MKKFAALFLALTTALGARAAIHTETIEYKQGDETFEGFLAYDDAIKGPRPGILVIHQWFGLTEYEKNRCTMLAKLGYVAFAADIFGKGVLPKDYKEAGVQAVKYKSDRPLFRSRVTTSFATLLKQPNVDPKRTAAIGYCFGGSGALELARTGADVSGVISFHGGLDSPTPADGKNIKCKVLACHGGDDPFETPKSLEIFESEMRDAGVDWQLIKYGGAVHAFTQPMADGSLKGAKYNERADKRSWADMQQFFNEIFK